MPRRTACGYRHQAAARSGSALNPSPQPITVTISETANAIRGSRQRTNTAEISTATKTARRRPSKAIDPRNQKILMTAAATPKSTTRDASDEGPRNRDNESGRQVDAESFLTARRKAAITGLHRLTKPPETPEPIFILQQSIA